MSVAGAISAWSLRFGVNYLNVDPAACTGVRYLTKIKNAVQFNLSDVLALGPPPPNNLAVPVFHYGSMEAELYQPQQSDAQTPHTRDEIYVVAIGHAEFFNGSDIVQVQQGSFIFVPAGIEHRFLNFSSDFAVWVFFYGPVGGELP